MNSDFQENSQNSRPFPDRQETGEMTPARKDITSMAQKSTHESGEHSQNLWWQSAGKGTNCL